MSAPLSIPQMCRPPAHHSLLHLVAQKHQAPRAAWLQLFHWLIHPSHRSAWSKTVLCRVTLRSLEHMSHTLYQSAWFSAGLDQCAPRCAVCPQRHLPESCWRARASSPVQPAACCAPCRAPGQPGGELRHGRHHSGMWNCCMEQPAPRHDWLPTSWQAACTQQVASNHCRVCWSQRAAIIDAENRGGPTDSMLVRLKCLALPPMPDQAVQLSCPSGALGGNMLCAGCLP